jgi:hypothetical protein
MDKGYIYIVSDGVGDVFKFGFTIDPLSRLCKYNATECLRPMRYELVAEYSTERESRDVEILIKNELKSHLYNSVVKPEVSKDNKESRDLINKVINSSKYISIDTHEMYNRIFEMSTTPSKLDYEGIVKSITETAKISGIKEGVIRESIIDLAVGYKFEDAPQRVIFEKRRKKLVNVDGLDIYYDTKPKLIERLQRLALLDYKLKTNYFSN